MDPTKEQLYPVNPDQVFPAFLYTFDLWGRYDSTQNRYREGCPELICLFNSGDNRNNSHDNYVGRLHMTCLPVDNYTSLGSLRTSAIRKQGDSGESRLTMNLDIDSIDSITCEAVFGLNQYNFQFTEPVSRYLAHPDNIVLVGNNIEGLVGWQASSAITRGRFDIQGLDLIEAMILRGILPENILIDGSININSLLHHILIGKEPPTW